MKYTIYQKLLFYYVKEFFQQKIYPPVLRAGQNLVYLFKSKHRLKDRETVFLKPQQYTPSRVIYKKYMIISQALIGCDVHSHYFTLYLITNYQTLSSSRDSDLHFHYIVLTFLPKFLPMIS